MRKSIFDSKAEMNIYKRLKTHWSKYVDVFPQIQVKNIIDYDEIKKFTNNPKSQEFLLKTSFDFVVCKKDIGIPILVIEFDGLSGGFSRNGKFYVSKEPTIDKYRKLKMDTKLRICSEFNIPLIVLSYKECNILSESNDWITILDVIIGYSIEKKYLEENHLKHFNMISKAYEIGGKKAAKLTDIEIDTVAELTNPVKIKINQITKKFPYWTGQIISPKENDGYLIGTFCLKSGIKIINGVYSSKNLIELELKMRNIGIAESDGYHIFNTVGEYCLARKTERLLGSDINKWNKREQEIEWTR